MTDPAKIRVMLVDDSAIVRGLMQRALKDDPQIEVVATAMDGAAAIDTLKRTPADIVVLDIEMPVMDGLTALPKLLEASPGLRVIMASTLTLRNAEISMRAMQLGAMEYLAKPSATNPNEVQEFYRQLISKIKALAAGGKGVAPVPLSSLRTSGAAPNAPVTASRLLKPAAPASRPAMATDIAPVTATFSLNEALTNAPRVQAVAIASSTGGPQALLSVFGALKGKPITVPIFITQHMPPNFTTILADHISKAIGSECHEAKDGEAVKPGTIYIAPGDYHMVAERIGTGIVLRTTQTPPENYCRPSADPMLRSLAAIYGRNLLAVVLTGMGSDGAPGAAEVVRQGGTVAAQNEATCVVYGMPRAVADAKLAKAILPLDQIAPYISKAMGG